MNRFLAPSVHSSHASHGLAMPVGRFASAAGDDVVTGFDAATGFALASASDSFSTRGVRRVWEGPYARIAADIRAALAKSHGSPHPAVVVGALPFDPERPARLFEPGEIVRAPYRALDALDAIGRAVTAGAAAGAVTGTAHGATAVATAAAMDIAPYGRCRVTPRPSREAYARAVAEALALMTDTASASASSSASATASPTAAATALRKVVLARSLEVDADVPFDARLLFERLRADPRVAAFSVPLPDDTRGGTRVLVGATPEVLLQREGTRVTSLPLAGSARRHAEPRRDRDAGEALLRSEKDAREHATVVEWIADTLAPHCRTLTVQAQPHLACTQSMWHLATRIAGDLYPHAPSSLDLAALLHPTPAVCGVPLAAARATIQALEPFDRGFFTGMVGWCDANGDGRWLVAIRCAEIAERRATLFAGAGIVTGSEPEAEADETSAKFAALLDALGVSEPGADEPRASAVKEAQ